MESFPSDGKIEYLTWQSPSGWEIERGELRMLEPYEERIVGYPEAGMSVITYSNAGDETAELVWVDAQNILDQAITRETAALASVLYYNNDRSVQQTVELLQQALKRQHVAYSNVLKHTAQTGRGLATCRLRWPIRPIPAFRYAIPGDRSTSVCRPVCWLQGMQHGIVLRPSRSVVMLVSNR